MECKLEGGSWIRNEWISCDLSGSDLMVWANPLHRNRFRNCKLMGADLYPGEFSGDDSSRVQPGIQQLGIRDVGRNRFDQACDCDESLFFSKGGRRTYTGMVCRLVGVHFFRTSLAGMDFTQCELGRITVSDTFAELHGARVTAMQALDLSRLLGIEIVSE